MDTISMMDDDPTLPIDFDQSTNISTFLQKDKMDGSGSRRESLLSLEESSSEAAIKGNHQVDGQNTPERATLREHEEIIATFKKENFGLKLRIYFLEERLQMAYEEDTENVLKTNIELKVNIEQLKKEVTEKQQLLIKASKAIETITTESEKHVNKLKAEFTKQYDDMVKELQQEAESRDQDLQEKEKVIYDLKQEFTKADIARKELEENLKALIVDPEAVKELRSKQQDIKEKYEKQIEEKVKKIKELEERKSNEEAQKEIETLKDQVGERDKKIQSLKDELRELASHSPDKSNPHYEILYNKLEAQNVENENKIKEITKELTKKSSLVEELKDYINKTDRVNKELRNSIHDKETEKHRSSISLQEHIRWKLNNRLRDLLASVRLDLALSNKEKEIEKLEESNKKLQKEVASKGDAGGNRSSEDQERLEAIAALKADLQEKEILIKKFKQTLEDKDKELMYFSNAKLRVERELDDSIAQKNLEILGINEQLKDLGQSKENKLKLLEDQCQKVQQDSQLQLNKKDKLIQRLSNALRNKDLFIEELLAQPESVDFGSETPQDVNSMASVIKKLRAKIKDMDSAFEANLDEKFKSIDARDNDILELKRSLRDKDRELELLKANVTTCEGLIKHLEGINEEKDRTMKDLKDTLEVQENAFKVSSETATQELEGCQMSVLKLSRLLEAKEEEINELQKNILKSETNLDEKSITAIYDQLNARHKLNQELASERDAAVNRNEINKQKFISALNSKDNQIREVFLRMGRLSEEKNGEIKKLQALVEEKSEEIGMLEKKVSEFKTGMDASELRHQSADRDKDNEIENFAKSGLEKDRIIGELQERLNLKLKETSHAVSKEIETLKEKLRKSEEDLAKKSDELTQLKTDNKHLQEKLNDLKRSENIEITMKFDNLRSELDDKERKLKDAKDEMRELQSEIKQSTSHAERLQKKVNSLQKENDAHLSEIAELKGQSTEKDATIKEMQKMVNDSKGLDDTVQKLKIQANAMEAQLSLVQAEAESLKSQKNTLEKKLKEADLATLGLEKRLEDNMKSIESMVDENDNLKREAHELKLELEKAHLAQRQNDKPVNAGIDEIDAKELRESLKAQIEEQKKLCEAAAKEKSHFLKLIQEHQNNTRSSYSSRNSNMELELQSVNALKLQYEESIRQNGTLHRLLECELNSLRESTSKNPDTSMSPRKEIADLQRRLEESEKWNKSLQSRLNQFLPRASGVGASFGDSDGTISSQHENAIVERLSKEHEVGTESCVEQKSLYSSLHQELETKSRELEATTKSLSDLKVHYDMFSELRNKEVDTLNSNCEQAKRVIKDFEEKATSLRDELQRLKDSKGQDGVDLKKQIDGISGINDVLRRTLNEKIEELNQAKDKALHQEEYCQKLEKMSRSLSEDKNLLMNQMQEKNEQIVGMKKEIESVRQELQKSKENQTKRTNELELLQRDRQELRSLNERLRRTLGDVSNSYESSEQGVLSLKMELDRTQSIVDQQRREAEQLNVVNMKLRDEIKSLQESSHEVKGLADELKSSQNLNNALQKQLNELAQSNERQKSSLELDVSKLRGKVAQVQQSNNNLEEKMRFYERQAGALQAEYREEKSAFEKRKESLNSEIEALKKEIVALNEVKADLELRTKELFFISESYKSMIERLEEDNNVKQNVIEDLEAKLHIQKDVKDHSTATIPQMKADTSSQTTPSKPAPDLEIMENKEKVMREALQKRDSYIEALRKQLEFYKSEKARFELELKRYSEDNSSSNSDLIALHISEMRELRRELEQTISNNNALRDHLEHRLSEAEKEAEKLKDPNVRVSLLRENDSLRAKIADCDIRVKELQITNDTLRQESQRSSGLVLEKDNRIKELKITLDKRNTEIERMQTFAPQETSSAASSPIQTTMRFTQTTPIKQVSRLHKEIQVDTIVAKYQAERKQLGEKIGFIERALKEKEVLIDNLERKNEREKQDILSNAVNMKSEITELKASIEKKDSLINSLEMKVFELEGTISDKDVERGRDLEKKTASDELIALHISEMQKLKRELELSIKNNEELKSELENRLLMIERDAERIKDPNLRVNIIRDNDHLRSQSIEKQNAVSRLQTVVNQLVAEKKSDKECIKKLHQQIHNLNKTTENLKDEVLLYDRLQQQLNKTTGKARTKSNSPEPEGYRDEDPGPKFDASLLQLLLEEIRNLRVQLQKSIDTNMALKDKLEGQLGTSFNSIGSSSPSAGSKQLRDEEKGNTVRRALFSSLEGNEMYTLDSPEKAKQLMLPQEAPTKENGSPGSRSGFLSPKSLAAVVSNAENRNLFVRGKLEDFLLLKNKVANSLQRILVVQDVHLILQKHKQISGKQMEDLQEEVGRIAADMKECRRLVDLIWVDEDTKREESNDASIALENQHLTTEMASLKKRLISQEKLLKTSLQRLEESNKLKENLEQQILSKLKTTHGTIVRASQNLKEKIDKSKTPPKKHS